MARLNKRILCFIDECGTAGQEGFALGCVVAWARDCGSIDKSFSDLLEPNANEIHAANLSAPYLQSLLGRFAQTSTPDGLVLMNRKCPVMVGTAPDIYADGVVETVKVALGRFAQSNRIRGRGVGNVELILDRNEQNTHSAFAHRISEASKNDGRFRAVQHFSQIDSAASRLLQLADVVAYSRMWVNRGEENVNGLHQKYGIQVL